MVKILRTLHISQLAMHTKKVKLRLAQLIMQSTKNKMQEVLCSSKLICSIVQCSQFDSTKLVFLGCSISLFGWHLVRRKFFLRKFLNHVVHLQWYINFLRYENRYHDISKKNKKLWIWFFESKEDNSLFRLRKHSSYKIFENFERVKTIEQFHNL
jgi:hypothetical protein